MLGTFGDSITTSPSYTEPLATLLGWPAVHGSVDSYTTVDLLAYIPTLPAREQATDSVMLIGINDIRLIGGVTAATITGRLEQIMSLLTDPVVVTLLPCGGDALMSDAKELVRLDVNTWIRANAPRYVDAELVMGDGASPQAALLPDYDSGDDLHLSAAGNTALGQAIYDQAFA